MLVYLKQGKLKLEHVHVRIVLSAQILDIIMTRTRSLHSTSKVALLS